MNDELIPGSEGDLVEKIGQELIAAGKTREVPLTPGGAPALPTPGDIAMPGAGLARQESAEGLWSFQFNHEEPGKLTMVVDVTLRFPGTTRLTSEISKAQISKLVEWLNRIMGNFKEF